MRWESESIVMPEELLMQLTHRLASLAVDVMLGRARVGRSQGQERDEPQGEADVPATYQVS